MRAGIASPSRRLRLGLLLAALAAGLLLVAGLLSAGRASGAATFQLPVAQPVIGLPVTVPTLIGSSPAEAPGETWGYGQSATGGFQIVRYTTAGGWQAQPAPLGPNGEALTDFKAATGPLAGATTADGGVAILGEVGASGGQAGSEQLLVRNPGGEFAQAPTLTSEPTEGKAAEANALLRPGEKMFADGSDGSAGEVLMSAVEDGADTDVFLTPIEGSTGVQEDVLFYDGEKKAWSREPICVADEESKEACPAPAKGFKVLAIDASSPQDAWLLAKGSSSTEGVVLFSRETAGEQARWVQRSLGAGGSLGAQLAQSKLSFESPATHIKASVGVAALSNGQPLTVSSEGVWVDGQLSVEVEGEVRQSASLTLYYDIAAGAVSASWCSVPASLTSIWSEDHEAPLCTHPLESTLPSGSYRSFAWAQSGSYAGERVITGLEEGVSLILQGESFTRVLGDGGHSGTTAGAAFSSPQEGWLAEETGPLTHLTTAPEADMVSSWPVPFEHPLTAIATEPGKTPGELGAQAIAVGADGQVAHYYQGQGWVPEALLTSASVAAEPAPELRGVAWPEAGRAYAVGTNGEMWLWLAVTGLWQHDPAKPPNLHEANFTGIAFEPGHPTRGYAIGQQGLLLAYGKTWQQQQLPAGLEGAEGANFTSIAFAGEEAIVTFQVPEFKDGQRTYIGGVLDNSGGGWQVDIAAEEAIGADWGRTTNPADGYGKVPIRVTGLPDGGAVLANSDGQVIERQEAGQPWLASPAGSLGGAPVALAAVREDGTLRAVVSVGGWPKNIDLATDEALREPVAGEAPVFTAPYALPSSGYLVRETAQGWRDEEHEEYPVPSHGEGGQPAGETGVDWPLLPDAILALALPPEGGEGWALGGQTGEINAASSADGSDSELIDAIQTAGVMRYPASGAAPEGSSASPEQTASGDATFAIGGGAQCASACANLANDQLGPDEWLSNAVQRAAQTSGVRAFLDTGPHLAAGLAGSLSDFAFQREEESYAGLLAGAAGQTMKAYAAPSETDLNSAGTLASFTAAMGQIAPAGSAPAGTKQPAAGSGYYAIDSEGSGGTVRVIVLDYSHPSLGEAQQCWLANQLASAKAQAVPAIVVGNRGMTGGEENTAADAAQVVPILVNGTPPAGCGLEAGLTAAGASAYFFDSPEQDRVFTITAGGNSIDAYGSGTLGYVKLPSPQETEFLGAAGFLLAEVELAKRNATTNKAPVHVQLTPDIASLAIDATGGVLLRRSHAALFDALGREPQAGMECQNDAASCVFRPDPYVPIPDPCQGSGCATAIFPEYTFTSSKPGVGEFVEPDPASPGGTTVLQGANGKPIADEHSGLFCAYNAGTTTVTVHTGGLAYSEQVTVRGGSVEEPCGTAPLENPPAPVQEAALATPLPTPAPTPAVTPSASLPPPPPTPTPAAVHNPVPAHKPIHHRPAPPPIVPAQLYPLVAPVPPPAPAAPQPTPPSGTAQVPVQSPVAQTVAASEREEEYESAIQHVHNMVAHSHAEPAAAGQREGSPLPAWPIGLVILAALAAAGIRPRREKQQPVYAWAKTRRGGG